MKVLVLGHGAVGSVLVKLLEKDERISSIICADKNFSKEETKGRIKKINLDLSNQEQIISLLNSQKPDLVVNAASPFFNEKILDACTKSKSNYFDMAAAWEPDSNSNSESPYKIEQFDFSQRFVENNTFGLIEAGVSPGITNLLARECADELDEVETIKIRLVDYSGSDELYFAWSKEALLDEINSKPLIYQNSKFKIVEPFSGEEEFDYPSPFHKKKATLICQDEIGTIPFFIKLKNIDIKDYDNQVEIHKMLYKLGLISKEKIKIKDTEISPFEFLCKVLPDGSPEELKKYPRAQFGLVVQAHGKAKGKKKIIQYSVLFPKQGKIDKLGINANFISYPTALSAKLFITAIQKNIQKGIFPPEALDSEIRKKIIQELKKTKNLIFKKQFLKK